MAIPLLFRRRQHPEIFISFYGDKLLKGFISHLIKALRDGGVKVSINNNIDHETDEVKDVGILNKTKIDNSKIAIVIFSDDFAESEQCLNDVMRIDERRSQGELKVIPVLYGVSVEDVRNFEGIFGQCLKRTLTMKLKRRFDHLLTQHLMGSLTSVARRNGLDSQHYSNESDLVEAIIDSIKKTLPYISTKQTISEQVLEEIVSASVVAMFCYCLKLNYVIFHDHDLGFFISPRWYLAVLLLLVTRHTLRFIQN